MTDIGQENIDAENKRLALLDYEKAIKAGGAMKELAIAANMAKTGMELDGLKPTKDKYGEWVYTAEQGNTAACHAREEAATILLLQVTQLKHLHSIKWLLWGAVCLLVYIASNVH